MALSLSLMLLAPTGPAVAQDDEVPLWITCSGMAEYIFWVYGRIQDAGGHTDFAERIHVLRVASGLFVQAHAEDIACDIDREVLRGMIQSEANNTSDAFALQQQDGVPVSEILGEYDAALDVCIGNLGEARITRLMDEFAQNGPPCGWQE